MNCKFFIVLTIFLYSCDLSSSRPNLSSQDVDLPMIKAFEASPIVQLFREILTKQNEIADLAVPVIVRALVNPVPGLADALQRSMALFGVTSYLVGPTIAHSARNLGPVVEPLVGSTDAIVSRINQVSELEPLFEQALTILGINNDQCKEALTCQAGKMVARDYPTLASYLSLSTTSTRSSDDKFAKILTETLSSRNAECTAECPNLILIEKYWKEAGEKDILTLSKEAFSTSVS